MELDYIFLNTNPPKFAFLRNETKRQKKITCNGIDRRLGTVWGWQDSMLLGNRDVFILNLF